MALDAPENFQFWNKPLKNFNIWCNLHVENFFVIYNKMIQFHIRIDTFPREINFHISLISGVTFRM